MIYTNFVTRFRVDFVPAIEIHQLARKFQDLWQTIEIVDEIITKFRERALLVLQFAMDEETKKTQYHDMLIEDIREFVSILSYDIME